MKVAFFELNKSEIPVIEKRFKNTNITVIKTSTESLNHENVSDIKDAEILSVFLGLVDQQSIESLPNLKLITTRATGFDKIDTDVAKQKGIPVCNVPAYGTNTVAEYAMGLILMLSRKLHSAFFQSLFGLFDRKKLRGHDLAGKTIGILGTGKIGCHLAKLAYAFGMKIICTDPYPNEDIVKNCCATYVPIEELYKTSDIISIHVPYTKETHHLINFDTLKLLKPGVLLVNTARGPVCDISAIRQGVKDEILGGVAMDTFEGEQIWIEEEEVLDKKQLPCAKRLKQALEAFYLLKFKNVILTPHNAFNSYEALARMLETNLCTIETFIKTGECKHKVC